jgi:hypothetical protein
MNEIRIKQYIIFMDENSIKRGLLYKTGLWTRYIENASVFQKKEKIKKNKS